MITSKLPSNELESLYTDAIMSAINEATDDSLTQDKKDKLHNHVFLLIQGVEREIREDMEEKYIGTEN